MTDQPNFDLPTAEELVRRRVKSTRANAVAYLESAAKHEEEAAQDRAYATELFQSAIYLERDADALKAYREATPTATEESA